MQTRFSRIGNQSRCAHCHQEIGKRRPWVILCEACERAWEERFLAVLVQRMKSGE